MVKTLKKKIPPGSELYYPYFDDEACRLALHGKQLPPAFGSQLMRDAVIRGIRYHAGFGEQLRGLHPVFTRALNARNIMSNIIPDMKEAHDFPYCIWHPETAEESTYRRLAQTYPQMRYQVGRACAVAGFTALYRELDLLPETHIAEEARDNGSVDIFNDIMAAREKYSVMNDYTMTVDVVNANELEPAHLNDDTAVRSQLEIKHVFTSGWLGAYSRTDYTVFDITEDHGVAPDDADLTDALSVSPGAEAARKLAIEYLYTPLPMDLPPLRKDILILVAAYQGQIDRYARLRRPFWIKYEISCVIRGIYHNTFFAKWWGLRLRNGSDTSREAILIRKAINARAIINNDISRITSETPSEQIPYCIWYPSVPGRYTLRVLALRRPDMKIQIARAIIYGDFGQAEYDALNPPADGGLICEAMASPNPYYLKDQEAKRAIVEQNGRIDELHPVGLQPSHKALTRDDLSEPNTTWLRTNPWPDADDRQLGPLRVYDGKGVSIAALELWVSSKAESNETGRTAFGLEIEVELSHEGFAMDLYLVYRDEYERITGPAPSLSCP